MAPSEWDVSALPCKRKKTTWRHQYRPPDQHQLHQQAPLLLSPYFRNDASTSAQTHVLPSGYFLHTTSQHSHIQTPNNTESKGKRKRDRKKKNEGAVVSPYFQKDEGEASTSARETETEEGRGRRISFNKFHEAYRRKSGDNTWIPPRSRHGLLQEEHYEDPWKVLIICMLLNRTTGCQAANVIANLFELCPNAKAATKAETEKIENIITTLGLQKKRSMTIQKFSQDYLSDEWTHVTQLHGVGKYAADAYAIFCTGHWKDVNPDDQKLVLYWQDLWITEETRLSVT